MEDKKMNILVIDDEPEIADTLKRCLSVRGYEVDRAFSGEDALRIIADKRIDLVVLDIMMHGIRGTSVAKIIKDKYPDTKIIVVTAYPEEGKKLSEEVQLEGLFIKPFGLQEFYNKLLTLQI